MLNKNWNTADKLASYLKYTVQVKFKFFITLLCCVFVEKGFGGSCSADDECPTDAKCLQSICGCDADRYENTDRCTLSELTDFSHWQQSLT